jgi:hypothetical protein
MNQSAECPTCESRPRWDLHSYMLSLSQPVLPGSISFKFLYPVHLLRNRKYGIMLTNMSISNLNCFEDDCFCFRTCAILRLRRMPSISRRAVLVRLEDLYSPLAQADGNSESSHHEEPATLGTAFYSLRIPQLEFESQRQACMLIVGSNET